jgi:hypothetical protein
MLLYGLQLHHLSRVWICVSFFLHLKFLNLRWFIPSVLSICISWQHSHTQHYNQCLLYYDVVCDCTIMKYILFDNTTGMNHLKIVAASQAHILQFKNQKKKFYNSNANRYFNQECLHLKIVPNFAKLMVHNTSTASTCTCKCLIDSIVVSVIVLSWNTNFLTVTLVMSFTCVWYYLTFNIVIS